MRMDEAKYGTSELRIVKKNPGFLWGRIWTNLHAAMVKSAWYAAIHDIVPTNNRLAAIRLTDTNSCARCGEPGSILRALTECMEGRLIWTWARARLGILCMDPRHIPPDWPIRPAFQFWSPQRQAAILWIIAHLVDYRLQSNRRLFLKDFLRRARWKAHHRSCKRPNTGRYLDLL
jgi:hypothetical protein